MSIGSYIKEQKRLLLLVIALGLLTAFFAAALMFTSGFLISKAATRPENLLLIYVPIVAVRAFGIGRAVSRYAERLLGHHAVLKIVSRMRTTVYEIIEPQVLSPFARFQTGDVLGLLAEDIEKLQDIYLKTIFPSLVGLTLYLLSVLLLGLFSWPFALLMAVYAAVLVFLFPFVSLLATKARVRQMKTERHALYEKLTDAVIGIGDWQFSGRQADFIRDYEAQEQKLLTMELRQQRFLRWRATLAQAVVLLMVISMLGWASGQAASGALAPVMIAAFVLVLFPLTEAFLPLSDAVSEIPAYDSSRARLAGLETQLPDTVPVSRGGSDAISFSDVSFRYGTSSVLEKLTFSLQPGETLALLGPSGAGKSTLLKLVQGVIAPSSGTVAVNGEVAVLNQQPHLFDTSVLNNIRLGNPAATDEEVQWAAKQVKLHDYISSLPNGYDTPMQETGMRFSGGERQRIALARVLLQEKPIVILDEPTIGLDPLTERELLTTMFDVLRGKTVLWVTHHLTLADTADQIIFLEKGRMVLRGTHEELLQRERYARLYRLDRPFSDG
ncbi:thiol reductant ABC exporter subunit CydC [Ectobacillus ponti]|uniref:Thiol reductant ABC exporter subunit CydC n=1 Tax=Ectobacillus ponti TaxID=2961894 RepID=A0AA42BR74_9BACI|nr:thiol reductant ABC exporter subunit CydC [Ectobacillus ponti]MCP8971050.1 thiol reductant ABC exporter subunit CydC [Ectobacillus ponti]